ncbi:hypothetical protein [Hydrogenimonas thermophila]|uniref:Uncharacterized protein n=1 Tax=Hydrogenimonas thermophila TaxID=223786 RepID=A0A1I5RPR9_9BACT|nr:hypothetical protein [Hydrogenimonas thermophila]SFP60493.1 hypothetical protein SAMN05216234_12812 [Hydrogenimonas thermophila]
MQELLANAKDFLTVVNLLLVALVFPAIRFIRTSVHANLELQKTIKELRDELHLLRNILFDIADGDTIKKHLKRKHESRVA